MRTFFKTLELVKMGAVTFVFSAFEILHSSDRRVRTADVPQSVT